jgi:ribosome biogenesis protein Nip4
MLENTLGTITNVGEYLRDNQKCYRIHKGQSKMIENTLGPIKNVGEYLRYNQKC